MDINNTFRRLCEASGVRLPLRDASDVSAAFSFECESGVPERKFADRLRDLLIVPEATGIHVRDIRKAAAGFALERAIEQSVQTWDATLNAIASCIPNEANLRQFADPAWEKAIDIGRALSILNMFPFENARVLAVAAAGQRLQKLGYRLSVADADYQFAEGEIERATARVRSLFAELGPIGVLANLFDLLKRLYPFDFEMYLPGRQYGPGLGIRGASIPFGFVINLAAGVPIPKSPPTDPNSKWKEAVDLSRDVVSAMNVEPYSGFAHIGTPTLRLEAALRELALFDHLFQLCQWRLSLTPEFLLEFFAGDHDEIFKERLGWTPADAADLCKATMHFATRDPNLITVPALRQAGIQQALLDRMLPHFAHGDGTVNAQYLSPYAAQMADLMFKPFIRFGPNHLLLPAASLMGPAFYEATMAALRRHVSSAAIDVLQGIGTERVILSLFNRSGLEPTFIAAKYDLGANGAGECDLVFESDGDILLVECKAKALTRGSMAGVQGNALLDFAGGMFAAQTQALRHERILRSLGAITFSNGSRLEWKDRRITRLSITLLDHGALQDRMTFRNLLVGLLGAAFHTAPGYAKTQQVQKLNAILDELRSEVAALDRVGQSVPALVHNTASLNVGQLEVILDGAADLEQFRKRVSTPVTSMTLNPLYEYHFLREKKIVK